eukprot:3410824-Pleurochrysis_carterae.AAC.1
MAKLTPADVLFGCACLEGDVYGSNASHESIHAFYTEFLVAHAMYEGEVGEVSEGGGADTISRRF